MPRLLIIWDLMAVAFFLASAVLFVWLFGQLVVWLKKKYFSKKG